MAGKVTKQDEPIVDMFRPEDAEGVAAVFRSVYGEGYPIKIVYKPKALIAAFEAGENIPVVARAPTGEIVGYAALFRSAPNPMLYEAGQALVLPAYRGIGVAAEMARYTWEVMVPKLHLEVMFGEAVCNHTHIQKMWAALGNVETALEVDLMPREAYVTEGSAAGRVAGLAMFRTFRHRKQVLYLPAVYESPLRYMYSGLKEEYDCRIGKEKLPKARSDAKIEVFDFAQVVRIALREVGDDLGAWVSEQEKGLLKKGMVVFQIWLSLSWPWIDRTVEILREHGYFLGGPLPRWFREGDGLLMQKVVGRPNWEGIHLYSERAKNIMDIVYKDWLAVNPDGR